MKKLIIGIILYTSVSICQAQNNNRTIIEKREIATQIDGQAWISVKSFSCESQGYQLGILRLSGVSGGASGFKLNLNYSATINEYCGQARRDILASSYSSSQLFESELVTPSARTEQYCDKDNLWIIGTVYIVRRPNPNIGITYTSDIFHDANIENNISSIQAMVQYFNLTNTDGVTVPSCYESKCGKVRDPRPGHRGSLGVSFKEMKKNRAKSRGGLTPVPMGTPASKEN
jgi:hypothetical protein